VSRSCHIKSASSIEVKKRQESSRRKNSWRRSGRLSRRRRKPGEEHARSKTGWSRNGDWKRRDESHGDTGTKRTSNFGSLVGRDHALYGTGRCTCTKSVTYEKARYLVFGRFANQSPVFKKAPYTRLPCRSVYEYPDSHHRLRKIISIQRPTCKALRLHPPPCSHIANFTILFPTLMSFGGISRSTVASLDAVAPTPRRLRSWRLALASRVSLAFHSFSCCLRFCDRA
jgi:hypothetical protein